MGLHSAHGEAVAHPRTSTNLLGNPINATKLGRQVNELITMLDDDKWLIHISDVLLVHVMHVFSNGDLSTVVVKSVPNRVRLEVHSVDNVDAHVSPVGYHRRINNLRINPILKLCVITSLTLNLPDLVEARDGRDEAREGVDTNIETGFGHEDGGLVASEHLELHSGETIIDDRICVVEEARVAPNLLEMGFSERILDNDVKYSLTYSILAIYEVSIEQRLGFSRFVDHNLTGLAQISSLNVDIFFNWRHREDHLAAGSVGSHELVDVAMLGLEDVIDT